LTRRLGVKRLRLGFEGLDAGSSDWEGLEFVQHLEQGVYREGFFLLSASLKRLLIKTPSPTLVSCVFPILTVSKLIDHNRPNTMIFNLFVSNSLLLIFIHPSIPHIVRARMEEIALRRHIQIRNHADLRVINIHDRKLRHTPIRPQARVIHRPMRLIIESVVSVGVGVHVGDERDEPVFHVLGYGGVVDTFE